ncbi:MAG: DUF86 domain-containing protein [Phycisphaerales bacterium]|nr:DUF86 domain-containing protein [Phycisphaerales bacterium]
MPRDPARGGPNDRERLQHMLDAALDVRTYVAGRGRADLDTDSMLRRALVNALQVVGEAAARVTDEGRARVSALPWGQIVAARHILVHVYWGIDADQVWNMAVEDVPALIAALEAALVTWPLPDKPEG